MQHWAEIAQEKIRVVNMTCFIKIILLLFKLYHLDYLDL